MRVELEEKRAVFLEGDGVFGVHVELVGDVTADLIIELSAIKTHSNILDSRNVIVYDIPAYKYAKVPGRIASGMSQEALTCVPSVLSLPHAYRAQ